MDQRAERELDRLLAGGGVSGPQRDELLARILEDAVAQPRRRPRWRLVLVAMPGALALTLATLWLLPADIHQDPEFRARGSEASVTVEHACQPPQPGAAIRRTGCRRQDRLLLRFEGVDAPLWVAIRAESKGESTWYFPTADGVIPRLHPQSGPQLLDQAPVLLETGMITLRVQLFHRAVSRAEAGTEEPWAIRTIRVEVAP